MFECAVYAHVYAQTVHTCAAHEKMFISYMDIQTCKARRLHHYTCTVGRSLKGVVGLTVTLSKPQPTSAPPLHNDQLRQVFLKVGPFYRDLLHLSAMDTVGWEEDLPGSWARVLSQA